MSPSWSPSCLEREAGRRDRSVVADLAREVERRHESLPLAEHAGARGPAGPLVTTAQPMPLRSARTLDRDRARLLVVAADQREVLAAAERVVEVHRAAAGHHEDVRDAQGGDALGQIVRELYGCHARY